MPNLLQRKLLEVAVGGYIGSYTSRNWSSITFSGDTHQFCFIFTDLQDANIFCQLIADEKVDVNLEAAKMMFASIHVVERDTLSDLEHVVTVEVVTLDEG